MLKPLVIIFALLLSPACFAVEIAWPLLPEQAKVVAPENLATGVFYYHYLNEDYQAAANQLKYLRVSLPAEAQSEVDILEITLLLALGIEQQAQQVFAKLEGNTQASARAWLFMARRWLAHGQWQQADFSADHGLQNADQLSDDEYQELLYTLTLSAVEQERLQRAKNYFERMKETGHWADLARYNLLVAFIESYAAVQTINKLLMEAKLHQSDTPESRALVDRSYLLAGIYMLDNGHNRQAEQYFKQIQQDSPYAAEGLLFYGWSLLEQSNYYAALQPWRVLQQNYADWHPAVIESVVAVPHTMEMMNASTQALRGYELVEERITQMLGNIQALQSDQQLQQWLQHWLEQQQGEWGWRRQHIEVESSAVSQSLLGLMSDTVFRNQLAEYYDLYKIQQQLAKQSQQAELWQQMLAKRQQILAQANGAERLQKLQQQQAKLLAQLDELEQRWQAQELQQFSYTSESQKRLLQRLDSVVASIKLLQQANKPTRNLDAYKERWRRNRGLMLWEMTYNQSAREWSATREFWQLDGILAEMRTQLTHSQLALEWSAFSWQGLQEQVSAMQQRLQSLQARVHEVQQQQQQDLTAQMQQYLAGFKKRLLSYQSQARLATARLYDDALQQQLANALVEQLEAKHD